jgi:copper(I)-binding protein
MRWFSVAIACGLAGLGAAAASAEPAAAPLVVHGAWARATPAGAEVGAGYLVIDNHGAAADRLMSVSTQASERVELHSMRMDSGVMRMRQATEGLSVPAGGSLRLEPGGAHIMFIRPKQPFVAGGSIEITLHFEHASALTVKLPVMPIGASGPP